MNVIVFSDKSFRSSRQPAQQQGRQRPSRSRRSSREDRKGAAATSMADGAENRPVDDGGARWAIEAVVIRFEVQLFDQIAVFV